MAKARSPIPGQCRKVHMMNPSTDTISVSCKAPFRQTVTWVIPPLFRGDSERVKNDSPIVQSYRWIKVDGYERSRSWDELAYGKRFSRGNAKALGHTRETWEQGYIRSWGIDPDNLQAGDRIGHQ